MPSSRRSSPAGGAWARASASSRRRSASSASTSHNLAVANGTAALHLALLAVGCGPGDEVVLPSLNFVAAANIVLHTGAAPVFCDIRGERDLNLDPDDLEAALTSGHAPWSRSHYGGYPVRDRARRRAVTEPRGIAVVEDAAHAVGATLDGRAVRLARRRRLLQLLLEQEPARRRGRDGRHGRRRARRAAAPAALARDDDAHLGPAPRPRVGVRRRLARLQLPARRAPCRARPRPARAPRRAERRPARARRPLPRRARRRRRHRRPVRRGRPRPRTTSPWSSCPRASTASGCAHALAEDRIQTSVHYPPIHRFTAYAGRAGRALPRTDAVAGRILTLPLFPHLTDEQLDLVVERLLRAVKDAPRNAD